MPADTRKPVRKANEKATHGRSSKAYEVRILKSKKRKCMISSEGSSEPGKKSEEKDKKTDKDIMASKQRKGKSCSTHRSHPQSVASGRSVASEIEDIISTQDDDIIELLSINTRHSSEGGNVSGYFMEYSVMPILSL
jgi:hypothetical protein